MPFLLNYQNRIKNKKNDEHNLQQQSRGCKREGLFVNNII